MSEELDNLPNGATSQVFFSVDKDRQVATDIFIPSADDTAKQDTASVLSQQNGSSLSQTELSIPQQSSSNGPQTILEQRIKQILDSLPPNISQTSPIRFHLHRRLYAVLNNVLLAKYNILPSYNSFYSSLNFALEHEKLIIDGAILSIDLEGRATLEHVRSDNTSFYIHFNEDDTINFEIIQPDGKEITRQNTSYSSFISAYAH